MPFAGEDCADEAGKEQGDFDDGDTGSCVELHLDSVGEVTPERLPTERRGSEKARGLVMSDAVIRSGKGESRWC